ncbi:MAG: serine/threonine-protein kinase [Planctomycetia bacterium]|nr:serine/threonine-protein kinase [Planctomycetia bacterium]
MGSRLTRSQKVKLQDGRTATVIDRLGEGGQGTVYKVCLDGTGEEKALKWYFIENVSNPQMFYDNLKVNIETGAPSPAFVWPEALTEWVNGTFGYIMRIFPKEYESFSKYLMAKVHFRNAEAAVNAALNIVSSFKVLHNCGYSYQDLNDGNFSIHPQTGDVLICDNDNVMGHGQFAGVRGKARYMAPEVVRGEKQPDRQTDKFSLAVVLFMLFFGDHPLEGKKTNVPALTVKYDRKIFGEQPLFIFDEKDDSNRPIPELHRNAILLWPFFPRYIHEAFGRSFCQDSLLKAQDRLLEQEWLHLLVRLKSSIVKCPKCKSEIFLESHGETTCPDCKASIKPAGYIRFLKRRSDIEVRVPIFEGTRLFSYHMTETSNDYQTEVASILTKPGKFGLKNNSTLRWAVSADGKTITKQPGDVVVLGTNLKIDFGNGNVAEIC